jgi:hypothetical protein
MTTTTRPAAQEFPGLAIVLGFQEDGLGGGFWLYNLTRDIPGHPAGSTVSAITLNKFVECSAQRSNVCAEVRTVRAF